MKTIIACLLVALCFSGSINAIDKRGFVNTGQQNIGSRVNIAGTKDANFVSTGEQTVVDETNLDLAGTEIRPPIQSQKSVAVHKQKTVVSDTAAEVESSDVEVDRERRAFIFTGQENVQTRTNIAVNKDSTFIKTGQQNVIDEKNIDLGGRKRRAFLNTGKQNIGSRVNIAETKDANFVSTGEQTVVDETNLDLAGTEIRKPILSQKSVAVHKQKTVVSDTAAEIESSEVEVDRERRAFIFTGQENVQSRTNIAVNKDSTFIKSGEQNVIDEKNIDLGGRKRRDFIKTGQQNVLHEINIEAGSV